MTANTQWQTLSEFDIPVDWVEIVQRVANFEFPPDYGARLLWQRGIRDENQLKGFLSPEQYQPTSPFAFGEEMEWAVNRLVKAREQDEKVAIWGDFDADGITATSVLWDGLGQFFEQAEKLTYFIPNRLKESHGLSSSGLAALAEQGVTLIVTCDTGSTDLEEIVYAKELGMDVIVTDHHTLPAERPPVVAIINPRSLDRDHPLAHLSGVAVAFKLVEALYAALPDVPSRPLSSLLDLVAIGLIADLVELTGDCRYLAQKGIQQLQTQRQTRSRPGVARLLELCRRTGDRPTDISFGIGPRINAVSRIHGDASFCVELLTSQDIERCEQLAQETEAANARRKGLQNDVLNQVKRQLEESDLSTTGIIVLADPQWPTGVLGIVAGQIAQELGKPTILFTLDEAAGLARGSARSVNRVDLYELVDSQAHLLEGFGGHPFAAGMSLRIENLPLFKDAINRQLRQAQSGLPQGRVVTPDLRVLVSDLGRDLFKQLSLLEPCGMGNAAPKLLIKDCWFENTWHQKIKDPKTNRKIQYIKACFLLRDETTDVGFPGTWWGHYKEDLPSGRCDVIAELDFNSFSTRKDPNGRYELRLIDIRPAQSEAELSTQTALIIDQRRTERRDDQDGNLVLTDCPSTWQSLRPWFHQAATQQTPLILAYSLPNSPTPNEQWKTLVGIAKYLSRTEQIVSHQQLAARLQVGEAVLSVGLTALKTLGFKVEPVETGLQFGLNESVTATAEEKLSAIQKFLLALQEEQFRHQYFYQVPIDTAQSVMADG
ncbi:MAG: single-stranded-DNA-specific exonuclease RecJ [Cyanobacteria bacterium J06628_6]